MDGKDGPLTVRWDDQTINREAALLPDAYQEDYRWLKGFTRDECAKDIDQLIARIYKAGGEMDKTTAAKIIRGRITVDHDGVPRENPVMNLDKLQALVRALREGVRLESIQGRIGWVETSVTRMMFSYFRKKWATDTVNKFGIVSGPTGSGKSAAAREFQRQNNHGACVHLEAPEGGGMQEFISRLGVRYGINPRMSSARKRDAIFATVKARNMIIIDNAQELWSEAGGMVQPRFSFLRRLQDETGCTVILMITPMFEDTLREHMLKGYFEQFVGRTGGVKNWIRLPDYPPANDCVTIAKSVGLVDAPTHKEALHAIAREPGRIRRLFEDLQAGQKLAKRAAKPFTFDFVSLARGDE